MNEEQSEELIKVLIDVKEELKNIVKVLKPKQEIKTEIVKKHLLSMQEQRLIRFKNYVTSNNFYNTLTEKQKEELLNLK